MKKMKGLARKLLKDTMGLEVKYHKLDPIQYQRYSWIAKLVRAGIKILDPLLLPEMDGERVVFHRLQNLGLLEGYARKRILEIGPKHGKDSLLLADLNPKELVLLDLPAKNPDIEKWLPLVSAKCNTRYVPGNILYLTPEDYRQLGKFDLIWCVGVLYHNAEQMRLLKRLFNLCNSRGLVVVESEVTHNRKLRNISAVEIYWPNTFRNVQSITHLPSTLAIKNWMEMCGFVDVKVQKILSKYISRGRGVVTGIRPESPEPYLSYENPMYVVGDST